MLPLSVFLMLLPRFAFCFNAFYGCHWKIMSVKTLDAFENLVPVPLSIEEPIDITKFVGEKNIFAFDKDKENFFVYPYSFRLEIKCFNEEYTEVMSREALAHRFLPFISICVNKYSSTKATVCSSYQGALFDPKVIGCINGSKCLPFWMFPVVIEDIIMVVTIRMHGIGWPFDPVRLVYRFSEFAKIDFHNALKSRNDFKEMKVMKYISVQCTVLLLGPYGADQYFLISTDDFYTIKTATYEQLVPKEQRMVLDEYPACQCADVPSIVDAATVSQYAILITKFGVIVSSGKSARLVLHRCVKAMTFNLLSEHAFLVLFGGCADEGKVFVGTVVIETASFVSQTLIDSSESSPCKEMTKSGSECRIVDIVCTAADNFLALLFLNKVNGSERYERYAVVFYTGDTWVSYLEIPNKVPVPELVNEPLLLEEKAISKILGNSYRQETLILTAFKTALFMTHHIYIYGSRLLHSPDLGQHFYLLPVNVDGQVKVMVASRKGFMIAFTDKNEIWSILAGTSVVLRIYPSSTTDKALLLLNLKIPPVSAQFLTAFLDNHDEYHLLAYSNDTGITEYSLPCEELFYYHGQQRTGESSQNQNEHVDVNCHYSSLRFDFPCSQLNTRRLDYTFLAPSLNGSTSYNKISFLTYHAILKKVKKKHQKLHENSERLAMDYSEDLIKIQSTSNGRKQLFPQFLYQNELLNDGELHISFDHFKWDDSVMESELVMELPEFIYLNYGESYCFTVIIKVTETDDSKYDLSLMNKIQLFFQVSDVKEVSVVVKKRRFTNNNTVSFQVSLISISPVIRQNVPGEKVLPVTVDISVANSSLRCFRDFNGKMILQGYYHTTVIIGCPPAQHIEFDWESSLQKLMESRDVHDEPYDCLYPNTAMHCFYFLDMFYPFFNIIDLPTGKRTRYTSNFTLRVVYATSQLEEYPGRFTDAEIHKYNNMDSNTDSLIWKPNQDVTIVEGWPVFNYATNGIRWYCLLNSPCADITPNFPRTPELYLLIEFSNAVIPSSDTRCNYTMNFWLHLHGLPLNTLHKRLPLVLLVLLMSIVLCLSYFVCHRYNKNSFSHRNQIGVANLF